MSEISGGGGGLSYSKEHGLIWEYLCEEESDFIFDEIFVKQVYARHGIVISEGSTVIDVGANIGLFSLFCIQQTKSINILCIEPLPPNFKALKRNLADYARKSNDKYCIAFEECAVGNCSEGDSSSDFYFFPGNPGESTRYPLEQLNQRNILLNAALDCGIDEIKDIALQQLKNRNIYSMHNNFDSDQHCGLNLHERVLLDATDERQILKSSPTHGLDNDDNNINSSSSSSSSSNSSSNNNNDNNNNDNNNINDNNNDNNNSNNNNNERQEKSTKSPASEIIPNNSKFKCRIKTLEKIIIEQNILSIDLIKIDVEGDELNALLGIGNKWAIIKQIIIEIHDIDNRLNIIISILKEKGYTVNIEKQETKISAFNYFSFVPPELQLYLVYGMKNDL